MKDIFDSKYHTEFCDCCGCKSITIWKHLIKRPLDKDGNQRWAGHLRFKDANHFREGGPVAFCGICGEKLGDEDMHIVAEDRGEFWGAPCRENVLYGYKCSACGFEMEF